MSALTNPTNTSTLDDIYAEIIAEARHTASEQTLLPNLIKTFNIGGQPGKVLSVPKYGTVTAAEVAEGNDITASALSTTEDSITVKTYGASVLLSDFAVMSGQGNVAAETGKVLGNAVAAKVDDVICNLFTSADFTSSIGAAGAENSVTDIFKAVAHLRNNKYTGQLTAVLHPFQAYAIKTALAASGSSYTNDLSNEALRTGYIGNIAGVNVFEHSAVKVDGSDDATGFVFAEEALGIAMKRDFEVESQRDASARSTELVATMYMGADVLEPLAGVKLVGDALLG
jgi:N4-gp56 family major capsid protein